MEGDVNPEDNPKTPTTCTESRCVNNKEEEEKTLTCTSCRRKVHYKCTLLPPYQLQRILTFDGKDKHVPYVCNLCVKVPEYLQIEYKREKDVLLHHVHERELKGEIDTLKEALRIKDKELQELKERLHKLEISNSTGQKTQKRRRVDDEDDTEDEQNPRSSEDIDAKNKEIETLKKQNENLNIRLDEREDELHKTLQQLADIDPPLMERNEKEIMRHVEQTIDNRMKTMQENLVNLIKENLCIQAKTELSTSYASATKGQELHDSNITKINSTKPVISNFRSIMMATKNEELAEERDKKARECNIIIHGKDENKETQSDEDFIKGFIREIDENIAAKSIVRIGRQENKKRSIKVTFKNIEEKTTIMINLKNLKGKAEYKGVSITDDYTLSERHMIKEFANTAKEKNSMEPENSNMVWKVRGTPKNGLVLKRLMKVKTPPVSQ